MQRSLLFLIIAVYIVSNGCVFVFAANNGAPKPQLNKPERPSEVGQRTMTNLAQPETNQPPPDMVGKVPKDLRKAGKDKETEKILRGNDKH